MDFYRQVADKMFTRTALKGEEHTHGLSCSHRPDRVIDVRLIDKMGRKAVFQRAIHRRAEGSSTTSSARKGAVSVSCTA